MSKSLDDLLLQLNSSDPHDRVLAVVTIGRERIHPAARYVEAALTDPSGEVIYLRDVESGEFEISIVGGSGCFRSRLVCIFACC